MLRKLIISLVVTAAISVSGISQAATKNNNPKYKGPLLRYCRMYQLGENEIIMKLEGRNLPLPECESRNNSLYITLNDSKIYHPDAIVSSLTATIDSIPMIYEVKAENVSDDEAFWGVVTVKANSDLEVVSLSRANGGWQFRVKSKGEDKLALGGAYLPAPKPIPSPESKLPFRVDSRITLELRDAELRDVLRGIMAYIGRNVIIDPSFPNDVLITMTLDNVRADDVLNQFMMTYDLACYTSGVNTLTFGTREGLYKLSGQRSIKQFQLHFAEPAQVSSMLRTLTALGDNAITVDERMKTVYVNTNPAKMQEVEELIGLLDTPQKQVMIRASIFEFNDNDSLTVSNALNIAYDDIQLQLGGTTGIRVDYRADRTLSGRTVWTDRVITDTFRALEQKVKGKVLANPSVIALDGKQAEINLTQDYPYVSDRDNEKGTVTWSTEEVGPKLTFTPRIGRDGYVTLTLDISTGDVVGTQTSSTGEQMPVTTTRSVKTEVRVKDGMPFVVGGLFMEDHGNNVSRIPVLGSIPLLGELFTYRSSSKAKTQVVMVITPYILDTH